MTHEPPDLPSPAKILSLRYALESSLASPGSLSGPMLEALQAGLGGARPDGARRNTQEDLRARLADLTLLCRGFSPLEERCCRLRYGSVAGTETYEALRRGGVCSGDLVEGDGEVVVDAKPIDSDGRTISGWVRVRGQRARYPSFREIARDLGLSARQVQTHLERARAKVENAKKWRHCGIT